MWRSQNTVIHNNPKGEVLKLVVRSKYKNEFRITLGSS